MCEEDLSNNNLTVEKLREWLRNKFCRLEKNKGERETNMALMTKQFKHMCNICGQIGHKGPDCFTLKENSGKKKE